jgi:DNA-binding transcriptional regulator YiaG
MSEAGDLAKVRALFETGAARVLREGANLSLSEASRSAPVDRTTLWRWEHRQRRPRGAAAIRYLRVLEELAAR